VNGTARNAEPLAGPDLDLLSVDRPGQHSVDAVELSPRNGRGCGLEP
jgi:hypothetical protein